MIRRPAVPDPADAALLMLLAAARALPFEHADDRLKAKQRLVEIGRLSDPPPEVIAAKARLGTAGDAVGFAEALLPAPRDISAFSQTAYQGPY